MEIRVCKSDELTNQNLEDIVLGLGNCLNIKTTQKNLRQYFNRSSLGYCFHALALDNNRVVGHTLVMPINYDVYGERLLFSQSGSTYILENYRKDIFLYKKMFDKLKDILKKNGVRLIFAVSNSNSFLYTIKFLKFKFLGNLSYFGIPTYSFYRCKNKYCKILALVLLFPILMLTAIASANLGHKGNANIRLSFDDNFYLKRLCSDKYKKVVILNTEFYFVEAIEGSIRLVYILDIRSGDSLFKIWLCKILFILRMNFQEFDLILDIGVESKLFNRSTKFITYLISRKLPVSVLVLDDDGINVDFKKLSYSLMNFDAR